MREMFSKVRQNNRSLLWRDVMSRASSPWSHGISRTPRTRTPRAALHGIYGRSESAGRVGFRANHRFPGAR